MPATLTPEIPAASTDPIVRPRRGWRAGLLLLCLVALLTWPAWKIGWIYLVGNIHEVIPGQLYRGAQPTAQSLEDLIDRHGIRTVLNTRGCCWPDPWYIAEAELCQRRGVNLEDVSFSAVHLPSRDELLILIDIIDRAERPIFVHCRHGADRTGIAAMTAMLLEEGTSYDVARRQLGLDYGHLSLGKTGRLDQCFQGYADWLGEIHAEHSPARFRHWVRHEYRGAWCDARFDKVERLSGAPRLGQALEYRVVVHNTSRAPWRFTPLKTAGNHVIVRLYDEKQEMVFEGRGGMLNKVVAPGDRIELLVRVPPINQPGHYRVFMDMMDEGHCWFQQTGSEPWEEEFELRE